ncbi:MAG: hypothetical protein ABMA26_03390 [Limisphaerales bacterium]
MTTQAPTATPECEDSPEAVLASPKSKELHAEIRRHLAVVTSLKEAIGALREFFDEQELDGDFEAYCSREFGIDVEALFDATERL